MPKASSRRLPGAPAPDKVGAVPNVWIISLGGSLIAPGEVDTDFLGRFCAAVKSQVAAHPARRFVVVCGGGDPARRYQSAYRALADPATDAAADWVGIAATRLNAELLKQLFADLAPDEVVTDPTTVGELRAPVLVAAGWKPGFSHDYDAVLIAERLGTRRLVKLSAAGGIRSADPRLDRRARAFDRLSWAELQRLTGDRWAPGHRAPFDPIATARAGALRLTLVVTGSDLANLQRIIDGGAFSGTTVGPR